MEREQREHQQVALAGSGTSADWRRLTREARRDGALAEILQEREAQDAIWRTGRPNEGQYQYAAPHVLLLEENADKLRRIWYGAKDEGSMRERFVKIAAIALRALEEIEVTA